MKLNAGWNKRLQIAVVCYLAYTVTPLGQARLGGIKFFLKSVTEPFFEWISGIWPFSPEKQIAFFVNSIVLVLPLIVLVILRRRQIRSAADKETAWIVPTWLVLLFAIAVSYDLANSAFIGKYFFYYFFASHVFPYLFKDGIFSPGFVFIWGMLPPLLIVLLVFAWRRRPPRAHILLRRICAGAGIAILTFSWAAMAGTFLVENMPAQAFAYGYGALWLAFPLVFVSWSGWKAIGPFSALLILVIPLIGGFHVVPHINKDFPFIKPVETEEDDRLDEKMPVFFPSFTRAVKTDQYSDPVFINESDAVVELNLARVTKDEREPTTLIYPTFRDAVQAARETNTTLLPSIEMVDAFGKYFDDRILAAVELHIHRGSSIFEQGKQGFLAALLQKILLLPADDARDEAAAFLAAAIVLGGDNADIPNTLRDRMHAFLIRFQEKSDISTPSGFYTNSRALTRIFRRDRFLQRPFIENPGLDPDGYFAGTSLSPMVRIAHVMDSEPALREAYNRYRRLAEKVCNPDANMNIDDLSMFREFFGDANALDAALKNSEAIKRTNRRGNETQIGVAFWPFATSKEVQLFAKLYRGNSQLPPTEVMGDLINAIRAGRIDLAPLPDSGWYDYQTYALETLLLPNKGEQSQKLFLRHDYKKILRRSFSTMITKRRETHIKNLFSPIMLSTIIRGRSAYPSLSVQPCATAYLRTARAYRFLASELRLLIGPNNTETIMIDDLPYNLDRELENAAILFYGLYISVCNDLCMIPTLPSEEIDGLALVIENADTPPMPDEFQLALAPGIDESTIRMWYVLWNAAQEWLDDILSARFLAEDQRVIVPVLGNAARTRYRYWATLGTRLNKIEVRYARPPRMARSAEELTVSDPEKINLLRKSRFVSWESKEYFLPVNVFEEVTLGARPLTREQFRKLCSQGETREEILESLVKGTRPRIPGVLFLGTVIALTGLFVLILFARKKSSGGKRN